MHSSAFPEVGIGLLGVSFAFGLTVLTMVYAVGPISGGHFNPAVSLGLAVAGKFEWQDLMSYIIAQCLGAALAGLCLYLIVTGKADLPEPVDLPRMAMEIILRASFPSPRRC